MKYLLPALLLMMMAADSFAVEYHGMVSIEDYYSDETSSAYNFNILTTRLRLDAIKLNDGENLSLHFDGRERNSFGSSDYSSANSGRVDTLNMDYISPSKRQYLAAGRLWPKELPAERVDGLNAAYLGNAGGMGIFGGLKPDPYTEEFNTDHTSAGIYTFYRKNQLTGNIAFIQNLYKGGIDREYVYGQSSWSAENETRFYGFITADINPRTSDVDLTNGVAEISFRPASNANIALGYNQYKSVRFYESSDYDVEDTRQQSYYIRGDYRFLNIYSLYGRYELRSQHYQETETELKHGNTYQAGFRNDNLFGSGVAMDVGTTIDFSFGSTHNSYRIDLSRLFMEVLQIVVNGSYQEHEYDIDEYSDDIYTYGAAWYLGLAKAWNMSMSYEGIQATDYSGNSVMSRVGYKF